MSLRRAAWLVIGFVAATAVLTLFGGLPGTVVAAGVPLVVACFVWPRISMFAMIVAMISLLVIAGSAVTGLPLSAHRALFLVTAFSWLLWVFRRHEPLTVSPQMAPLLAFAGVVTLGLFVRASSEHLLQGTLMALDLMTVYFLVANLTGERRAALVACAAFTTAATLSAAIGVGEFMLPQYAFDDDLIAPADRSALGAIIDSNFPSGAIRRVTGGLADANWLAMLIALAMPLNLFWFRRASNVLPKVLIAGIAATQGAALVFTYTRSGFIALAVVVLYLMVRRLLPVRTLVAVAVVVLLVAPVLPFGFLERMFSKDYLEGGSTPFRRDLAYTALDIWMEEPVFGHGIGEFGPKFIRSAESDWVVDMRQRVFDGREPVHYIGTHNLYLEIAVEYGLLGLVPFLAFLAFVWRDLKQTERAGDTLARELAICLSASLLAFLVLGFFGHTKLFKPWWILVGITPGLRRAVLGAAHARMQPSSPAPEVASEHVPA
jgi:hypothetical protein